MTDYSNIISIAESFGCNYTENESMSEHTTFRIGGPGNYNDFMKELGFLEDTHAAYENGFPVDFHELFGTVVVKPPSASCRKNHGGTEPLFAGCCTDDLRYISHNGISC